MREKLYHYKGSVARVIDGDTIVVLLDVGFDFHTRLHIRVLDVDCPEIRTLDLEEKERGFKAKSFVEDVTKDRDIYVRTEMDRSFARWLGDVYIDIDGDITSLKKLLVDNGHTK